MKVAFGIAAYIAALFVICFVGSYEVVRVSQRPEIAARMPNGFVALWRWLTRHKSGPEGA